MAAIDSVYNYYLTTYGNTVSRYDTHKKSELRTTWNNIVKTNKESPLYKIDKSSGDSNVSKFVIDLKEKARAINNVISSLNTDGEGLEAAFSKKVAFSSNPDVISTKYVGENADESNTEGFDLEVIDIAKPQINRGTFLRSDASNLAPGNYTFDLTDSSNTYEFQFSIANKDTNLDIQNKLASLINNANISLKAEILNSGDATALQITSTNTGLLPDEEKLFDITTEDGSASSFIVDTLGIGNTYQNAQNSSFFLNGSPKESYANTFTINKEFEVTLLEPSKSGETTRVGFKPNVDAVFDNVSELVDAYNSILATADDYQGTPQHANHLRHDFSQTAFSFEAEFADFGIDVSNNGKLSLNKDAMSHAITNSEVKDEMFNILGKFKDALDIKSKKVSVDPMRYVNKVVVAYKNPGQNFATPYITSNYSGMMCDIGT